MASSHREALPHMRTPYIGSPNSKPQSHAHASKVCRCSPLVSSLLALKPVQSKTLSRPARLVCISSSPPQDLSDQRSGAWHLGTLTSFSFGSGPCCCSLSPGYHMPPLLQPLQSCPARPCLLNPARPGPAALGPALPYPARPFCYPAEPCQDPQTAQSILLSWSWWPYPSLARVMIVLGLLFTINSC